MVRVAATPSDSAQSHQAPGCSPLRRPAPPGGACLLPLHVFVELRGLHEDNAGGGAPHRGAGLCRYAAPPRGATSHDGTADNR